MPFGISENRFKKIKEVFYLFPEVKEAIIFGSRALSTDKPASDLDIAVKGEGITTETTLKIKSFLEELPYGYNYDVIAYKSIKNKKLLQHIDKFGLTLYKKIKPSEGWNTYKLIEIIDDISMGPFGSNLKVDNFIDDGVPVIRGMNLNDGGFEKENFVFVSEEKAQSLKRSLAYPDDLVFTHRGTIGQVAIIPQKGFEKYLVSQSQVRLRVNKAFLIPKFLYYFFKSPLGQRELLKNTSQVGVPAIASPTKSLKEIEIIIPEINTQQKIVSILSSLDDKIELNLQMNQTLESIAQAIFKQWFVDFQFPGATGEMANELPKGWRNGNLDNVIDLVYGKGLKEENRIQGKYPVVGSNGIVGYHNQFLVEGPGIVIGRKGTIGEVIWIEENFTPIDTTFYIKDLMGLNELYFHYYLLLQQDFKKITSDSAVPGLNRNSALSTEVIVPQVEVISMFNDLIRPFFNKIQHNIFTNNILIKIRDSLLPRLITGQLPVN